jgi:hypothetical protein
MIFSPPTSHAAATIKAPFPGNDVQHQHNEEDNEQCEHDVSLSAKAYNYLKSFIWLDYTISNLTCQDAFTGYQLYDTLE